MATTAPHSQEGLRFYDLSHPWGKNTTVWPGFPDVRFIRRSFHAQHGTQTEGFSTVMHASTHINAPLHLDACGQGVGDIPLETFFGRAVIVSIPKGKWELIEIEDLEAAQPQIEAGQIVLINTGWHHKYGNSQEYFGEAPGMSKAAAQWLVSKKVKLVGMDTAAIDHPMATSLVHKRNGPIIKRLAARYQEEIGVDPLEQFPDLQPAHTVLLEAGIPTIEELGGQLDEACGQSMTVAALPWKWKRGDASLVRVVAIADETGDFRFGGETDGDSDELIIHDLSHEWGHDMPFWPAGLHSAFPPHEFHRVQFHARNGALVQYFNGVMHRGTHMDCPLHVQENTHDITGFPLSSLFGTGMVVSIPKGKWEVITPQDLENVEPPIQRGDIVIINTGYHKKYSDSAEYFHYGPGLYLEAAQWLVERGVKMVAIDVQALDHPLGTYIADHGPGPMAPHLNDEYKAETGRDILQDFPLWEPAHKTLLCNGIPGVENAGGDLDALTGKRMTFMAFPLRWEDGDGSVVRLIGIEDPSGSARL